MNINAVITGSGHFLPSNIVKNSDFLNNVFYTELGEPLDRDPKEIIEKFTAITEIEERRYADAEMVNSDMGAIAAKRAIENAGINGNDLDYIIVAHNFGDVKHGTNKTDIMPSLASKIKNKAGITSNTVKPYDILYGCPGWIEGMILADNFIKSGLAKNVLVVATEMLSRVIDPFDRDSMIFADGAGAVVLQAEESNSKYGIISHNSISDNNEELDYLYNGKSYNPSYKPTESFIRMEGKKIYEYALTNVPAAIKKTIDDAGLDITDTKKLLIHQANAKMDDAILKRLLRLYKTKIDSKEYMPMTIQKFGNSSVATIPTMYDLISKKELDNHEFNSGDNIVFASVGAGMVINSMVYRVK